MRTQVQVQVQVQVRVLVVEDPGCTGAHDD
jgi:hypothetical protein